MPCSILHADESGSKRQTTGHSKAGIAAGVMGDAETAKYDVVSK